MTEYVRGTIFILVSRDTRTGALDARPFADLPRAERFRDQWEKDEPGHMEFKIVHEAVRQ